MWLLLFLLSSSVGTVGFVRMSGAWMLAGFECAEEGIDVSQGTPVSVRKCSIVCTPKQSYKFDSRFVSRDHHFE